MDLKLAAAIFVGAGLGAVLGEMVANPLVKATGVKGAGATFVKTGAYAATTVVVVKLLRQHFGVFR